MSENPDQWEQMLRAVLGDEAAEQILGQMRSQGIDPGPQMQQMMNPANFNQVVSQVRAMLGSSGEGPINWKIAEQVARETIQRNHSDSLSSSEGDRARTSLQTANLWLDPATNVDPCGGPSQAWSRLDWLAHTLPTFRRLVEPVGANLSRAFVSTMVEQMEHAPDELKNIMGGNPEQMMESMIASVLGMQFGAGLAELATSSFGTSDAGLPLVEGETAALVPSNIAEFAADLDAEDDEVILFAAVREQAAARLYSRLPWLRRQVLDSVEAYAREIEIDTDSIEEQVRGMSMNPEEMQNLDLGAVFAPSDTDAQEASLARLEHLLSLVEAWVSTVSAQAVAAQLPHAVPLDEMFSRRSATNSPVNLVFGQLVGLDLKPRKVREAAAFWRMALERLGVEGRDHLWSHPDLLPTADNLENPQSFFEESEPTDVEAELDAFLESLLGGNDSEAPHEPAYGEEKGDGRPGSPEGSGSPDDDGPNGPSEPPQPTI
ncbi:MAG: zinc-dependent metalloprotease [Ancrocorticia sp.]|uniref:zinc-dependent metalloprotease n=1 Tax=Ancrocorticia sp. TaxID=2593684 RepID=UPI003F90BB0E